MLLPCQDETLDAMAGRKRPLFGADGSGHHEPIPESDLGKRFFESGHGSVWGGVGKRDQAGCRHRDFFRVQHNSFGSVG
jgi:hypothetical protein